MTTLFAEYADEWVADVCRTEFSQEVSLLNVVVEDVGSNGESVVRVDIVSSHLRACVVRRMT